MSIKHGHGRFLRYEHKFWERTFIWLDKGEWTNYFLFEIEATRKTDHAGFGVSLVIMRLSLEFQIYDQRHWDKTGDCWHDYHRTETEWDEWL